MNEFPEQSARVLTLADSLADLAGDARPDDAPKPLDDPRLQELFMSAITGVETEIFKSQIPGGMISNLIPDIPGLGGNALGTNFWRGGFSWVGEAGPELVYLPRGSGVDSASDSRSRKDGGQGISIGAVYVQNEMDAYTMAYQLNDLQKRRERR